MPDPEAILSEQGESSTATGIGNSLMSRIFGDSEQQFSMGGLINVPDHLRIQDEQAFTPLLISIGPIHHSNVKLQTMKKCKVHFCRCLIQRVNIDLELLEHTISEIEGIIRSYYAETIVSNISSDDFVAMIMVDAMFIFEYFSIQSNPHLLENDLMIAEWMPPILRFDLILLENQLPFSILDKLFQQANQDRSISNHLSLKGFAFEFFQHYNFQNVAFETFDAKIEHFTDLVRFFYLSANLPNRLSEGAKLSYSATQLHEAGIKFKVAENGRSFLDIRFDQKNRVLEIPCIKLNNEKIRVIQNIIALEQSNYVGQAYVTDFFVILDFLIDTSKDVDLLCNKGILVNYLGDSNAAASAINSLNTNISWDFMNSEYSKICADLNAFYKEPWHRWRAMLRHQYFSTPWRATSTCAAIILLLFTAIQTVCSLKSIKWW